MPRAKPKQETGLLTSTADKSRSRESRVTGIKVKGFKAGAKEEKSKAAGTNGAMEANGFKGKIVD